MFNKLFKNISYMITKQVLPDQSIVLSPKEAHKYSLIWVFINLTQMHGLGDSSMGFLDLFANLPIVKPSTKVLLLQAPNRRVTINMGMEMTSWFDIKVLKSDPNMNFDNFQEVIMFIQLQTVSMSEIEDSKKKITNYLQ